MSFLWTGPSRDERYMRGNGHALDDPGRAVRILPLLCYRRAELRALASRFLCLPIKWRDCEVELNLIKLDLSSVFNVKAAATSNDNANFDGSGRAYPAEYLPTASTFNFTGIEFDLPPFHNLSALDAVKSSSQTVTLPTPTQIQSFNALAIAYPAVSVANLTLNFDDNTSDLVSIIVAPWYSSGSMFDGPIFTPWHYANPNIDGPGLTIDRNLTHIHFVTVSFPSDKNLTSVTLPPDSSQLAFFSISLIPAVLDTTAGANGGSSLGRVLRRQTPTASPALGVQNVRSTTKWFNDGATGDDRIQIFEIIINNLSPLNGSLSEWVTANHTVSLTSSSFKTVTPGTFRRLRTDDQVTLLVGVQNNAGISSGSSATAIVTIQDETGNSVALATGGQEWQVTAGIPDWQNTDPSLDTHESPEWWNDAKFGIFIHWGVYSVPAWAPSGQQYAEWYNWDLHNPPNSGSPTWQHHLDTYGPNVVYDDFIANFTASAWNPDDWVDLFVNAGAKYFVLVTKHHDGFALFDTKNSSNRNSLLLGPKRDFVKELLDSSKARHPDLRRGTYFSLPEWFNPAYAPYAHGSFPGQPALNAFNGSCCDPFTGYIPVDNFLEDIQRPQMETLFTDERYQTEILWCDIGFASAFPEIGGDWYNFAAAQGRQVVRDDRCGANQTDYVTPEYATYSALLSQKWETSEGMDPFSYGYNSDTPPDGYQTAPIIVPKLVDIVSKGGNFLLDIGPKEDGTIIPEMTGPLLDVGGWLKSSGEAIYGTRPWWIKSADTTPGFTNVRFTTSANAFYVIAVVQPDNGQLTTPAPVPITTGDTVTLLGGSGNALNWTVTDGIFTVPVSDDELNSVQYSWAFKVAFAA
ncbi:glycoside hydrolase family 29 protein [Amylostereum chailletii]|nr:glycoside hydrolase family 29 protein [Amylostereum chailletii]